MFRLDEGLKVYLHREPVDFRLSINGLAALVQQALGLDPFAACVYRPVAHRCCSAWCPLARLSPPMTEARCAAALGLRRWRSKRFGRTIRSYRYSLRHRDATIFRGLARSIRRPRSGATRYGELNNMRKRLRTENKL